MEIFITSTWWIFVLMSFHIPSKSTSAFTILIIILFSWSDTSDEHNSRWRKVPPVLLLSHASPPRSPHNFLPSFSISWIIPRRVYFTEFIQPGRIWQRCCTDASHIALSIPGLSPILIYYLMTNPKVNKELKTWNYT